MMQVTRSLVVSLPLLLGAASDPGPRTGPPRAGGPLPGISQGEAELFRAGQDDFTESSSVRGTVPGERGAGLGPRYNGNSCASCHKQPAVGGTSPAANPLVAVATVDGAQNVVPWFIVPSGPAREARFASDGQVHDLYTISGRIDAPGCTLAQPDFGPPGDPMTGQGGDPDVAFRIPTPTFGAGLIEQISDFTLLANMQASSDVKRKLGISGHPNVVANDGTYGRFGWKAQNKSLQIFAAEAYNVEMGVTNELFPTERYDADPACRFNPQPEDGTDVAAPTWVDRLSDIEKLTFFMRFLAPPAPAPDTPAIANGRKHFQKVGCALCHTPSLVTGNAASAALSGQTAFLYSDLLVHRMGKGLADGIMQGTAGLDEFRTAPLWGLGQRIFFLHDGRTSDLVEAIEAHASDGSEANGVVQQFNDLPEGQKQTILQFLRSL